ncbi:hypothetical protein L6164_026836 [Bauhinia variegata]|uniref:Uncharacterized protein n=1 Tax=Bauhinia variegata TaxID=167791 RepID=A0ACB9LRD9_BAUVA|nr:hypothetical protein L6164_026836 [Bauhinia variegata]
MPEVLAFHFFFLLFSQLLQLVLAGNGNGTLGSCPCSFDCGNLGEIRFPFTSTNRTDCGVLAIHGCDDPTAAKSVQLDYTAAAIRWPDVVSVNGSTIIIKNNELQNDLRSRNCEIFSNAPRNLSACSRIQLPVKDKGDSNDPFTFLTAEFPIEVQTSDVYAKSCLNESSEGLLYSNGNQDKAKHRRVWKLALGIGIPGTVVLMVILWFFQQRYAPPDDESDAYDEPDPQSSSGNFGVPVFSYKELKEATQNFDPNRELGNGGYGTVYYGKLRDGREVAVKCLYEHNYRRVEQFMNEIEILRRLRHRNLVSLYGCTSHHSCELLLVYEYNPNGTVASHLYGDLAKPGILPWPIRMNIAIETASALAYLHASGIIHRDVKTNNILLDNNFCVKVADFGLSRLFPLDVTHVSTSPQGTPGYVDPEYYRCYQLTDKSDVYSFGVVLIELLSSMSPVDLERKRDEVNLSDLAVKKIQNGAFTELVDPSLGFDVDTEVRRMINSMAELAFQCLQWDKELRPSMNEVLEALMRIKSGKDKLTHEEEEDAHGAGMMDGNMHPPSPRSPDCDEVGLLKITELSTSPNSVTHKWDSATTTPNFSG